MGRWYTETDLRDFEPVWLLEVVLGGVVYRFASETIVIEHDSGSYLYDGTLSDVDLNLEVEFLSEDFDLPAAGVSLTFKDDLAKRISQGVDFGSATAELSIFRKNSGDDYDDRQVLIFGRVETPNYGGIGESVSFNIEADWLRNSQVIPSPLAVIDKSTNWGQSEDNVQGAIYPILIGAPGSQGFAGSPVYVVEDPGSGNRKGLIAGHQCTAETVTLIEVQPDGTTYTISPDPSVVLDVDANGIAFSYVEIPNAHFLPENSFFAKFDNGGGGLINPFHVVSNSSSRPGSLTGGGDLIRYLLHQSGAKVDDGRTAAASGLLNAFEFDGYIAERVDVMEFLKDEIIPLLPCSLRASNEGLYPVVWQFDATLSQVKTSLTANRDIFRNGLVQYESTPVFNEISLSYRHNCRFNKLQRRVTVTGDTSKETSGFLWRNQYAVTSQLRYGLKSLDLETEFVSSRATAGRIVNWMSRAYCGKHRKISYSAPFKLGFLQVGDIVSLTDADLSLSDQIVLIQSIEWSDEGLKFDFLLVPDLPRDTIVSG